MNWSIVAIVLTLALALSGAGVSYGVLHSGLDRNYEQIIKNSKAIEKEEVGTVEKLLKILSLEHRIKVIEKEVFGKEVTRLITKDEKSTAKT